MKQKFLISNIKKLIIISVFAMLLCGCDKDEKVSSVKVTVENNSVPIIPVERINIEVKVDESGAENANLLEGESIADLEGETENTDIQDQEELTEESEDTTDPVQEETSEEQNEESGAEASGEVSAPVSVTPGSVENVAFNTAWTYADFSAIHTGNAVLYRAADNRKGIVIGVNAGHGTSGGSSVKTYCHPDMTPKVTGGTTAAGSIKSTAVSGGMSFNDGTAESSVTLREAQILRDKLLANGYDVLMLRDGSDVQLDNIARTVICNNMANCHIAIHWDGDGLGYDKGCFYISTPDGIKGMEPVASTYAKSEALGKSLINGLTGAGCKIYKGGSMSIDLTQTSFSSVPSVDIELGNAASSHDDATLSKLADGLVAGVMSYFN